MLPSGLSVTRDRLFPIFKIHNHSAERRELQIVIGGQNVSSIQLSAVSNGKQDIKVTQQTGAVLVQADILVKQIFDTSFTPSFVCLFVLFVFCLYSSRQQIYPIYFDLEMIKRLVRLCLSLTQEMGASGVFILLVFNTVCCQESYKQTNK